MENRLNWERQYSSFQDSTITVIAKFEGLEFKLEHTVHLGTIPYWRLWCEKEIVIGELYGKFEDVKIEAEDSIQKFFQSRIDYYTDLMKKFFQNKVDYYTDILKKYEK